MTGIRFRTPLASGYKIDVKRKSRGKLMGAPISFTVSEDTARAIEKYGMRYGGYRVNLASTVRALVEEALEARGLLKPIEEGAEEEDVLGL